MARQSLAGKGENPGLEAQVLLAHSLSQPRSWVLSHPEFTLSQAQREQLTTLLAQRQQGEPLPYLIGHWEFYGLDFAVNPNVLIPRPETELLVEQALDWSRQQHRSLQVADVGTGSGCIAVSLVKNNPQLKIVGVDISRPALQAAQQNIARHGVQSQVDLLQADLLQACPGPFDLLCANLPYIPSKMLIGLDVVHYEPRLALDGGPDGLRLVEKLLSQADCRMNPSGLLLLEIEEGQADRALNLANHLFPHGKSQVLADLAGKPRLLRIEQGEKQ